mmetsp:Transcript_25589/g.71508  ORF Transcript_25589/g.71508 Transcript_25589/m.71508 type:complete len:258 (+) Transcript_25589:261-1034(+)|eukprot:CAMPEP_0119560948 /NCGR_PEP_ID=MMETSP1352-20130426/16252_1 /TAXON_ID=265584 /ORGANISM="Stauroneis constricta, Strain CCMP1120" /LENGTH=257 /DNA_ID=CAMNT_0007609031 /DNA_START=215 /DNA_END=988 /DNA_ORIENTATION=-
MADAWDDDSDDEWDVDDDILDQRLGLVKNDEEEEVDLAIQKKKEAAKVQNEELKKKGHALAARKQAEKERAEEAELARKALELEADMESKMTLDERRELERKRVEDADNALTDDLFGGVDNAAQKTAAMNAQQAGDKVVMKDLKDHLKHARRVAECMKGHGKIHLASTFLREVIQQSKDVLDDNSISEIIKVCNVIKNEKVQAAKRKPKGQANKSKKADKLAQAKAKKIHDETFGDNNKYDKYDEIGDSYEDDYDFF